MFQRTANYSVPARNVPLTQEFKQYVKQNAREIRDTTHQTYNGMGFKVEDRKAVETSPDEREEIYEAAWQRGGLQFRATFEDMLVSKEANDTAADFIKRKIRSIVKDPKTAAILSDIDHPYAAKRPPIDTDYFETYNRPNVSLVDVKATPIRRISEAGICTAEAEYPVDIIVFATGFDAMTGPLLRMDIRGRDGIALKDVWEAGPRNYLGLQVAGFPNLFTITGPGSPSVLCNMPVAIEQHADWITDCIEHMRANGLERIEARPEAVEKWVAEVNEARQPDAAADGKAFLVSRGQYPGQAARLHAVCWRHDPLSRDLPECGCARLRRLCSVINLSVRYRAHPRCARSRIARDRGGCRTFKRARALRQTVMKPFAHSGFRRFRRTLFGCGPSQPARVRVRARAGW